MSESLLSSPVRRALIIGIDAYTCRAFKPLRGCKNDAKRMAQLLTDRFCFPPDNICLLLDQSATRQGILEGLRSLSSAARPNDVIVVYYAGHGSRMRDREGTKPTGWDETLVPIDSGRAPSENRDITDDELRLWLLDLSERRAYVTLVFDCCHSGTLTRGAPAEESRAGTEDTRPPSELPQSPIEASRRRELATGETAIDILPPCDRYVVLSACRDEESAFEHSLPASDGTPVSVHGAFTYFLLAAMERAAKGGAVRTYRDVFELASPQVTASHPRQHPRIEGTMDRILFGIEIEPHQRGVAVVAQKDDLVTLHAGAAHGITEGSIWRLSVRNLRSPTAPLIELGQARVMAVEAGVAQARLLAPRTALPLPCRAVQVGSESDESRFGVRVTPRSDEVEALLRSSPWLRSVSPEEKAGIHMQQQSTGSGPVWIATSSEGEIIGTAPSGSGSRSTLPLLLHRLEQSARAARIRAIGNPRSSLPHLIDFKLLAQGASSGWELMPPDPAGRYRCIEGQRVGIELRNRGLESLFIAVLVVGMDHSVTQVYPPIGAPAQRLDPKRSLRIGAWRLCLPTESSVPYGSPRQSGVDTIKVLVTSTEVDYQPLIETGVRGGAPQSSRHPLAVQLQSAITGTTSRAAGPAGSDLDWTSLDAAVLIERRLGQEWV